MMSTFFSLLQIGAGFVKSQNFCFGSLAVILLINLNKLKKNCLYKLSVFDEKLHPETIKNIGKNCKPQKDRLKYSFREHPILNKCQSDI